MKGAPLVCAAFGTLCVLTGAALAQKAVFDLREVSWIEESAQWFDGPRGHVAECRTDSDNEVKVYPKLNSKRPLYGRVTFQPGPSNPSVGTTYHFVLDESGANPPAGPTTRPAPCHYDRLYFDLNRDLDLTNDPVLTLMEDPPRQLLSEDSDAPWQQAVFQSLSLRIDYGSGSGVRPFRVLPRLWVYNGDYARVQFISTVARKGNVQIGRRKYEAVLTQSSVLTGRFDSPYAQLELKPAGSAEVVDSRWWMDRLNAIRQFDGTLYVFSSSPTGDKLTVEPYSGDFGVFAVGAGTRNLKEPGVVGSIRSPAACVAIGAPDYEMTHREHRIPVGDYAPMYVKVQYGPLLVGIMPNLHSDGRRGDRAGRPPVYGMKIRKVQPFILDFSNKPDVIFASPAKNQVFKAGDEVKIAAVLVDPVLDLMIRYLDDTSRREKRTVKSADGTEQTFDAVVSMDPTVTITNASGKVVSTGKMPFG